MTEQKTSSRRALMKGVAWAAPVAAVAVAAPAYASSQVVSITSTPGVSCRDTPGDNQYYLSFDIVNNSNVELNFTVTYLAVAPNSDSPVVFPLSSSNNNGQIGVNGEVTWGLCSNNAENMAQATAVIQVRVEGQGIDASIDQTFEFGALEPCQSLSGPGVIKDPCPN